MSSREHLGAAWDVVVLAATIAYLAESTTYRPAEQIFPRLIAYPVAALAVVSIVRRLAPLRHASKTPASPAAENSAIDVCLLALGIGLAAAYAALWSLLGFALDTVALLLVGPMLLGLGIKGLAACAGIAVTLVVLFSYLFGTSGMAVLPGGVFGWQLPW